MRPRYLVALTGVVFVVIVWIIAVPTSTEAYTISTSITAGCHEKIISDALRSVRLDLTTAAPLPLTSNEQALVDDLEFTPAQDMRDLGGVTLLMGIRDNDLKGRAPDDLSQLAAVHGDPNNQEEHCLRNKDQDEPNGSESAVADCRAFIRGRIVEALDGLDAHGVPDLGKRTSLPIHLALRGSIDASLPTYYVRIGQAIHAMEDSFSHTYRTPDQMQITVVANWIDEADGTFSESRDGPAHSSEMDLCSDPDQLRTTKRRMATQASAEILRATLDPQKTQDQKMTTVDTILSTYLTYAPGCTFDNNWCDAAERQYKNKNSILGCAATGGGPYGTMVALLGLAMFWRRRKRIPVVITGAILATALALTSSHARAAEEHAPPPPTVVPVAQPGPSDPSEAAWGAYLGGSFSVDKPAFAGQLGIRRRMSTHWTFGWDAELNPWVSTNGATTIRPGVFNTYSTIILRFPLAYENFNLRTTFNLGVSYLLMDLYGASKGSTGLYAAVSPLGLEWKLSRVFLLIINPVSLSIPVPQLKGVPLTYPQYRFNLGLGILAG